MLIRIEITNFALIDSLTFEPEQGFTVLTGETGAGKSLIIDAIGALRGSRLSRNVVRSGTKKASIDGVFSGVEAIISIDDLSSYGILVEEDGLLFLSREVFSDGKSVCRINGKIVPLSVLRDIGAKLSDIHGQHDQQAIFSPSEHLFFLDKLCKEELSPVLETYTNALSLYKDCMEKMKLFGAAPEAREKQMELLLYQIQEIEDASWKEKEEESLLEEKGKLLSLEKIRSNISISDTLLSSEDENCVQMLARSVNALREISHLDSDLASLLEQAENAYYIVEALRDSVSDISQKYNTPSLSLADIEDRLFLFSRLKSKYGKSRDEIYTYLQKIQEEYAFLQGSEKKLALLQKERAHLEKELLEKADKLHVIREKCAEKLSLDIVRELSSLEMKDARFVVAFSKRPRERFFSKNGYDEVEFLFSANKGEPEQKLAKIASGGEASRIMLAIKTILSKADETPILIFDEIDAGISGKAASVVAEKLYQISLFHQVLCVTHMAQIASGADAHFFIGKEVEGERSRTILKALDKEARIKEVSRLLSGDTESEVSQDLAGQLIEKGTAFGS